MENDETEEALKILKDALMQIQAQMISQEARLQIHLEMMRKIWECAPAEGCDALSSPELYEVLRVQKIEEQLREMADDNPSFASELRRILTGEKQPPQ